MSETTVDVQKELDTILKKFGAGALVGAEDYQAAVDVIPTGVLTFDLATGVGGFPRGRVSEIYGPESAGKTSLLYAAIGQVHQRGGLVAMVDVENTFDPEWAAKFGVDTRLLKICQPDDAEQGLNMVDACVRSGVFPLVCLDSIAALVPRKELEGEIGDSTVGLTARLMGQALRSLTPAAKKTNTAVIFTNQLRMKVGVMFGNPETTPGGNAMRYFASMRVDVRPVETIKQGQDAIGRRIKAKIAKSKVSSPFRVALLDIMFDEGLSRTAAAIEVGTEVGVIRKAGAWLMWGDDRRYQGRQAFREALLANPDLLETLTKDVLAKASGASFIVEAD